MVPGTNNQKREFVYKLLCTTLLLTHVALHLPLDTLARRHGLLHSSDLHKLNLTALNRLAATPHTLHLPVLFRLAALDRLVHQPHKPHSLDSQALKSEGLSKCTSL